MRNKFCILFEETCMLPKSARLQNYEFDEFINLENEIFPKVYRTGSYFLKLVERKTSKE